MSRLTSACENANSKKSDVSSEFRTVNSFVRATKNKFHSALGPRRAGETPEESNVTTLSNLNCKSAVRTMALLGATMLSTAAFADQVTLKSADGTVNLVGDFVDYKDDS